MDNTKTDLLQTIKDQIAQENYGVNAFHHAPDWKQLELWPEVCKRYAFEVAKASLKKASDEAYAFIDEDIKGACFPIVVKSSIDNESNIILS